MRRTIPYAGLALIIILLGCGASDRGYSNNSEELTIETPSDEAAEKARAIESTVAELRGQVDEAVDEASAIRTSVDELRAQVDSLRSEIRGFSDGSDWKDIVPEVERKSKWVEVALEDLEGTLQDNIESVSSTLSDLESEIN